MLDGTGNEVVDVVKRHQGPDTCQQSPVFDAEQGEKQSGQQDHTHRTPAIKGMQKAHHSFLVIKGASLHDRTAKYFDQTASHGIDDHADDDADKRVREYIGQKCQTDKTQRGKYFRCNDAFAVADAIYGFCAQNVNDQLSEKEGC